MSGIANSLSRAVSPTTVPCKHRTTSRSRPAARRLSRRSNDGASTRRLSGWELRIAESAGVRVAWPAARPGAASVPTVSHTVTHSARRISYNSESRGVETAPVLLLLHFATPSTIVPSRAESRKGRNLRLPWGLRLSASARLQRGPAYGLRLSACGCRVTWLVGDRRGSVLPTPQSLLRSVYAGRLCVAGAIYLAAALKFAVAAPLDLLVTSFVLLAAVVVTIASYWYTHLSRRLPGRTFLYGQALFDVALITTVVHITGGPQSDLTPLYVPLIAVTAVLMPPASTGLITALVGIVYFADVVFGHTTPMTAQVGLQLLVFAGVAAVTAYFSSRVSVMGAEREALAGELRQARLEAADVLRSVPTGIGTGDQAGHLLYCNPAAEQILGFKERQWRGAPIMPEFAKIAPEFWAAITATARRGVRAMRVEATVRRPDRTFPIGVTTTTLDIEPAGEPRVTAIFTDISDSKRLEELHLRAERLEAVAELSSSLAHEIKNPLASIRSSVEQLGRAKRANPDEKFLTGLIVRESDRLSRLLSEFLDFSRVRATECRPLDLHQVAAAAIRLVREHPDCPEDAAIDLAGGPTSMEGDEDLLHRVVSNLVLNAVQAAGKGARVTVRTGRPAAHELAGAAGIENPVSLAVSDNGPGIPDNLRARLFDPFVTGRAGGTGLGLAIVQRAVEAHRGLVLVDSVPQQGTTFTVYFPAARRKEEAA